MTYRDDTIKVLEMICAELPPEEFINDEIEISLSEKDFEKVGLSINSAFLLIKNQYASSPLRVTGWGQSEDGSRTIKMNVGPGMDTYAQEFKYPETARPYSENYCPDEGIVGSNTIPPSKISIIIDSKKGIYRDDNHGQSYEIRNGSKRMRLISLVALKDKVSISEIEKELEQTATLIIKEIREINKTFRVRLSVVDDLILHIPTGGYALNKDRFDIKLLP